MIKAGEILVLIIVSIGTLSGCATRKQEITHFSSNKPRLVCIAKHEAVREDILNALEDGFNNHNVKTRIIDGTYKLQHSMWVPTIDPMQVDGCDAIVFYVANWRWDVTMYMIFANIWITNTDMSQNLAQATYTAGGGLNKFVNAREKIIELVDSMFSQFD